MTRGTESPRGPLALVAYGLLGLGAIAMGQAAGAGWYALISLGPLAMAYAMVDKLERWSLSGRWQNRLALLALFWVPVDTFLISGFFPLVLGHTLLLLQGIKVFGQKGRKAYLQMGLSSFLMLLVAATATRELAFAAFFAVYLLLSVLFFLLLLLYPEDSATAQPITPGVMPGGGLRPLLPSALLITLLILGFAVPLFALLPRVELGWLRSGLRSVQTISGFTEAVRLTDIGSIKESQRVVMRVEPQDHGPEEAMARYWRGIAFDYYTGRGWQQRVSRPLRYARPTGEGISLVGEGPKTRGRIVSQRVILGELSTAVLFAPYQALLMGGEFPWLSVDFTDTIRAPLPSLGQTQYTLLSRLQRQGGEGKGGENKGEQEGLAPVRLRPYLQLPPLSPRITQLAREATAEATTPSGKARLLERYLQSRYRYTLNLGTTGGEEAVEHFLFTRRAGHCEYFATAMAVMLRTLGIPARMVNGFHGGEWNEFGRYFLVRERDAHSWVEAYIPGQGWIGFDPTPAASEGGVVAPTLIQSPLHLLDSLRFRWYTYVIGYSRGSQMRLLREVGKRWGLGLEWMEGRLAAGALRLSQGFADLSSLGWWPRPARANGYWPVAVAALFVLALLVLSGVHRYRRRRPGVTVPVGTVDFYLRLLRVLARQRLMKRPTQTPLEFARHLRQQDGVRFSGLERVVQAYYAVRYGRSALNREEHQVIDRVLSDLERR